MNKAVDVNKPGFFVAGVLRHGLALLPLQLLLLSAAFAAEESSMEEEIDYLIARVADSDCTFIRNGREHDAEAARDHLQMKRERGKRYYDTTEEFVLRIASQSSWSGKDYRIRCGEATSTAKEWFTERLTEYRESVVD